MEPNISAEDVDFFVRFGEEPSEPSAANRQRMDSIQHKLQVFIDQTVADCERAYTHRGPPAAKNVLQAACAGPHVRPNPARLEELQACEREFRKAVERFQLLLQMGVGDKFVGMLDAVWLHLAATISDQMADREAEVQNILLALLSKQLAKHGPFHHMTPNYLGELAYSFAVQGRKDLSARILDMAYILLKHGERQDGRIHQKSLLLKSMRKELIYLYEDCLPYPDLAEKFLREQIAACEAAMDLGGFGSTRGRELSSDRFQSRLEHLNYLNRLKRCVSLQFKHEETLEVMEKALALAMELEGIKSVEERLQEAKGMSVKILTATMRTAGIGDLGACLEKSELNKMYAEKTFSKGLAQSTITIEVMKDLGPCLLGWTTGATLAGATLPRDWMHQHPEQLRRAESVLRQVLHVKERDPRHGSEASGTLYIMKHLKDALSAQHKYVEALAIGERLLSGYKRLKMDVNSLKFQVSLDRQSEDLRLQAAFRQAAKEELGERSAWMHDEDGMPAAIMFEKSVQSAKEKAANSNTTSSTTAPRLPPVDYDPSSPAEVGYAALLAGLGVKGFNLRQELVGQSKEGDYEFNFFYDFDVVGKQLFNQSDMSNGGTCWAAIIAHVYHSLSLEGLPIEKMEALAKVMSANEQVSKDSRAAAIEMAERVLEAVQQMKLDEQGSTSAQQEHGPIKRCKPKRTCIACGAYGASKRCSRCNQVFACDKDCFDAAWKSYHKYTCKKQDK